MFADCPRLKKKNPILLEVDMHVDWQNTDNVCVVFTLMRGARARTRAPLIKGGSA